MGEEDETVRGRTDVIEDALLSGALVDGRYHVSEPLGRGGMGRVYRALDIDLERPVALKIVDRELADRPEMIEGLRREAASLAKVRSDFVVQVYAFGRHQGAFFIAMELIEGTSLDTIVRAHARHQEYVPLRRALTVLRQVATGLGALHDARLVHRDVKPSNVVIEEGSGRPVVVDLGLSARAHEAQREELAVGTPHYMAPEQVLPGSAPITPAADVYAFACSAYEVLTSRFPFSGDSNTVMRQHLAGRVVPVSTWRPELASLDGFFERALAKEPADRFENGHAAARALMAAARTALGESAPPAPAPESTAPESGPRIRVLVVDDDDPFRKLATRAAQIALLGKDIEVRGASTGPEAVAAAMRKIPHLVLLDFELPGIDGVATLARIRELEGGHDARVVVLTARLPDDERWRFEVLGVQEIVRKPVELGTLVELVGRIAERSGWIEPASVAS